MTKDEERLKFLFTILVEYWSKIQSEKQKEPANTSELFLHTYELQYKLAKQMLELYYANLRSVNKYVQ